MTPDEQPAQAVFMTLPYPPSVNRYYRHVGYKVLISREGRQYRSRVASLLRGLPTVSQPASCTVVVRPPDRRRRDVDNILKALLDAIVQGGALADDSLIRELHVFMREPTPGGSVSVTITAGPATATVVDEKGSHKLPKFW